GWSRPRPCARGCSSWSPPAARAASASAAPAPRRTHPMSQGTAAALPDFLALARRVIAGGELTRAEARALFALDPAGEEVYDLFYAAHKVRRHFHGDRVTFCSILPTKFGNCSEDCGFCAQSAHFDVDLKPHPMMD